MSYTTISPEEAERIQSRPKPVVAQLREGVTVWLPGRTPKSVAGWRTQLRSEGLRVRTRLGERDGVSGIYAWAVSADEG